MNQSGKNGAPETKITEDFFLQSRPFRIMPQAWAGRGGGGSGPAERRPRHPPEHLLSTTGTPPHTHATDEGTMGVVFSCSSGVLSPPSVSV